MDFVSFVILHYKDSRVTDICVQSILAMEQQERIRIVSLHKRILSAYWKAVIVIIHAMFLDLM